MGHQLVAPLGPTGNHRDRLPGSDQLAERLPDRFRGVVGQEGVLDLVMSCHPPGTALSDAHRAHLTDRLGQGEGLHRGLERRASLMLEEDQHRAHSSPSSSKRSTTAGAASGPSPSTTVELPTSAGVDRLII